MSKSEPRLTNGDILGQVDVTVVPRFAGAPTFARLPRIDQVSKADIVEVAPAYDHAQTNAIAASHLAYDLITTMARNVKR